VRLLKLLAAVDWKSMLLVLTLLGSIGGTTCNFIFDRINSRRGSRVQEGVYERLAERMDELFERMDAIEAVVMAEDEVVPPMAPEPQMMPATTSLEPMHAPADFDEPVYDGSAPTPTARRFERADLPDFDEIQQKAEEGQDLMRLLIGDN